MPARETAVELNPQEQALCRALAKARFDSNRKAGVRNAKRGRQSNEATDLEGIGSELAFCKLCNLYPDLSIHPRTKETDTGDCKLRDGRAVDVKATRYKNGRLIAVPWAQAKVPLFALMVGSFAKYVFKGFMRAAELLVPERLGDLGHGPTYLAAQDELVSFVLPQLEEKQQ